MRKSAVVVILAALLATACGGNDDDTTSGTNGGVVVAGPLKGEVLVSGAASLTDALGEIEAAFETIYPDVDVVLNLGASSALREQIIEGAPADVFASASTSNMDKVVEAGEVAGDPTVFTTNLLQIAVPEGNPAGIAGLADFSREEILIGLCAEAAPCGEFARVALSGAEVIPAIDTNEPDVRALLTKIELGELDAAITYVTDVASTDRVHGVDIPIDQNVVAEYPIAMLAGAPNPGAAEAFVAFVLSDEGQAILSRYGFTEP